MPERQTPFALLPRAPPPSPRMAPMCCAAAMARGKLFISQRTISQFSVLLKVIGAMQCPFRGIFGAPPSLASLPSDPLRQTALTLLPQSPTAPFKTGQRVAAVGGRSAPGPPVTRRAVVGGGGGEGAGPEREEGRGISIRGWLSDRGVGECGFEATKKFLYWNPPPFSGSFHKHHFFS